MLKVKINVISHILIVGKNLFISGVAQGENIPCRLIKIKASSIDDSIFNIL